jgi:amino acid adenylation domain-containing protein
MWFLDQLNPGDPVYNRPCVTRLIGRLDAELLKSSLNAIITRHEILRTTFSSRDGVPFQVIHVPTEIPITHMDLRGEPESIREREAQEVMLSEARRAFDLASGPLLRAFLLRLADDHHLLLLCMHHIVFDGWSEHLLRNELAAHYQALAAHTTPVLPAMALQYGDYSSRQRQVLQGPSRAALLDYWTRQLKDIQPLELSTDRPRPAFLTHAGARESHMLPRELSVCLRELSRQSNATLFMTLLAAFQALLARDTGRQDIAVGAVIAGRRQLELESLIGSFINTLVLRTQMNSGHSFREVLAQVRATTLNAFEHQEMPFERLIAELTNMRDNSRSPLIQVLFQLRNMPRGTVEAADLRMEEVGLDLHTSKLDLALHVTDAAQGIHCQFEYNTDLFNADTVRLLAEHYERLLRNVVTTPNIPLAQLASWKEIAPRQVHRQGSTTVIEERKDTASEGSVKSGFLTEGAPMDAAEASEEAVFPASFAQQRLYFLERLDTGIAHYNICKVLRLIGPVDVEALEKAIRGVVKRHEPLRTRFEERDGELVQVISPIALPALPRVDLSKPEKHDGKHAAYAMLREDMRQHFDLGCSPLMRARLLCLDEQEHLLLIMIHHIVCDGWSLGILWHELSNLYRAHRHGEPSPLAEIHTEYADFVLWQRGELQGKLLDEQIQYWKHQLADLTTLELPSDRPRPAVLGHSGARHPVTLSPTVSAALKQVSQDAGATLFMTALTLFQILLARYSGQHDIAVGTPMAGRNRTETEPLIGLFVNTLVIRTDLSGNPSFRAALQRVRNTCFDAYDHQDLPFERLVEELHPSRNLSRHPLFQIMFTLQNTPTEVLDLEDLIVEPVEIQPDVTKFDLTLTLVDTNDGLSGYFEYNTDLFDQPSVARMAESFVVMTESAMGDPDQLIAHLPLLAEAARRRVLVEWNATEADYAANQCLHQWFEEQVVRTPDHVALVFDGQRFTYAELNRKANQLARYLSRLGVGPDGLVGICVERSPEMVVGLLGILKAGGAYVPIDPEYPEERVDFMLADAGAGVLLTQKKLSAGFADQKARVVCLDSDWERIAAENDENPACTATTENLAYVIYTSGSTGNPKGVMIPHRAICNHMNWMQSFFPLTGTDKVLQRTPFSFDASIWEFYAPLLVGAQLIMAQPGTNQDATYLVNTIISQKVTILQLVPSLLRMLLEEKGIETCTSLKRVFCGGEALALELHERFFSQLNAQLINLYGPTEACIDATFWTCRRGSHGRIVPIGSPISNTQVYVLDQCLNPLPIGVPGELHIGGSGLARGYLNQPEPTAEKFIPDPFRSQPGARLYKTGDLACYLPDGNIKYLGRKDHQVKVRGFRIELGEIEAALKQHHAVHEAVVLAREDKPDDVRLVAYVVLHQMQASTVTDLRGHLKQKLPGYMVPTAVVFLDALPLTPNGKLDRRLLPAPDTDRPELEGGWVAPSTLVQEQLAEIWREVLGLERVGIQDDFFDLGGHSLLATRVISRVRRTFGVEVSLRSLFESPTIAGLAAAVDAVKCGRDSATAAEQPLKADERERGTLRAGAPGFPTSFAQQRLWFLDQLNPGRTAYIIDHAIRIRGPLDAALLERAINEIIHRHESLRTTISTHNGEPFQIVAESLTLRLPVIDIGHEPRVAREARARALAAEISNQPFDLMCGPLLRFRLIRLDPEDHILAISIHHTIADGWSLALLQEELATLYEALSRAEISALPELPMQYRDFSLWQRERLMGGLLQRQLDYWRLQLKDLTPLELQTDRPQSSIPYSRGAQCKRVLPPVVTRAIQAFGRREGATPFMTVLAAFQLLLHRLCGRNDITVGAPVAGRGHPDSENLIGFFVNNLVLRTDLSGNPPFRELLLRVRETTLGAFAHQDVPFERLVEELQPPRDLSRNPLFDVMINYLSGVGSSTTRGGLHYQPVELERTTARFALTLYVSDEEDGGLGLCLLYQADLFEAARIECMLDQLAALLRQIVDAPDRPIESYSLVTKTAQALLPDPGLIFSEVRHEPVTSVFLDVARRMPTQTALFHGDRQWSYGELAASARSLASSLASWGVRKGDAIGISGDRSFGLIATMLAVSLTGGVMVPLDPTLPHLRRRMMLETARARFVLWIGPAECEELRELQQVGLPIHRLDSDGGWLSERVASDARVITHEPGPDDPAYVFFTSGTTGTPKGVLGCHKGLSHFITWQRETFAIGSQDRIAQLTSLSFDVLLRDIFLPLTSGAALCLPQRDDLYEAPRWLERTGVTVLHTVPTLLQTWLKDAAPANGLPELRLIFIAGEPLTDSLVRKWRRVFPDAGLLVNLYGPTETTLAKCYYPVPEEPAPGVQPVGRPLPQTQILILGPNDCLCGVGEPGEIVVRTPYRTLGYLNPDGRTMRGFGPNPFRNDVHDVVYRTGDRGRYRSDGFIEILGRLDDQVKIRGIRVEPAEVSAVLAQHPLVDVCTVVARVDRERPDEPHLAAYVVPTAPNDIDMETLRHHLRERLPAAMLPATFTFLDALPLSRSGKVDRGALPPEDTGSLERVGPHIAPRTAGEQALARIWCDVLKRTEISVHDDFFALGGHSLLLAQVAARMRTQFQVELSMRSVFEAPTIARLAALIEGIRPVSADHQAKGILRIPRTGRSRGSTAMDIQRMKK